VAEGVREKRFADADRADDRDVGVGVEEAQGGELIEQRAVKRHLGGRIPRLQAHRGIQPRLLHAQRDGETLAPCDFVAEDLQQEILVRHLLLARECEALGEGVEHARQLEPSQDGFEIRADDIRSHADSSPSEAAAGRSGRANWMGGRR
jgi:hypothetical protein